MVTLNFRNHTYLHVFVLLGWLNFILKEWLTISRGAEPHAQKANLENRIKNDEEMVKNDMIINPCKRASKKPC